MGGIYIYIIYTTKSKKLLVAPGLTTRNKKSILTPGNLAVQGVLVASEGR